MAGATIAWNENQPGANDNAGQGDDIIRSTVSNLRGGLDAEHHWPNTSGLHGAHREGSARIFVNTVSALSSADTSGRLMWTSDTDGLFYIGSDVGSGAVARIGGIGTPRNLPTPGNNFTHCWAQDFGTVTMGSSNSKRVTFTSEFSGVPYVQVSIVPPFAGLAIGNIVPIQVFPVVTSSYMSLYLYDSSGLTSLTAPNSTGAVIHYLSIGSQLVRS